MNGDDDMTPVRLIGFHEMDSALVDESAQGGGREGEESKNPAPTEGGSEDLNESASSLSDDQQSTGTTGYPDAGNGMYYLKRLWQNSSSLLGMQIYLRVYQLKPPIPPPPPLLPSPLLRNNLFRIRAAFSDVFGSLTSGFQYESFSQL